MIHRRLDPRPRTFSHTTALVAAAFCAASLMACSSPQSGLAGDWVAAFYRVRGAAADTAAADTAAADTAAADTAAADTAAADTASLPNDALPACEGDVGAESFRAWLRIDQTNPVQGIHLALYPDSPTDSRPQASNAVTPSSGMSGLVTGAWTDGIVQLDLVPDLDYELATASDLSAWRDHHLQLQSQVWGDRCWTARWAWVATDGQPVSGEQGLVFMRRQ